LPGAVALGLLASLLAHAAVYGGDHAQGGSYHDAYFSLAIAGAACFALVLGYLALAGGHCCMGSILAARLARLLPPLPLLTAAASGWFALGESIEGRHPTAAMWLIATALAAASAVLRLLAGLFIRAIGAIAVAVLTRAFAPRLPKAHRFFTPPLRVRDAAYLGRRFARPPPHCAAHSGVPVL
jgi:hypothetical protein